MTENTQTQKKILNRSANLNVGLNYELQWMQETLQESAVGQPGELKDWEES